MTVTNEHWHEVAARRFSMEVRAELLGAAAEYARRSTDDPNDPISPASVSAIIAEGLSYEQELVHEVIFGSAYDASLKMIAEIAHLLGYHAYFGLRSTND